VPVLKLKLDRRSQTPLFEQLRGSISQAVDSGAIKPGERLPSVAALSKGLHVTQSTVLRAFEDLGKAGYLDSKIGRGTFVRRPESQGQDSNNNNKGANRESLDPDFILAARRMRMGVAKSLESLQVLGQRPGMIAFTAGTPDPSIATEGILARLAREAFKSDQSEYQGYGHNMGLTQLRESVARRYDPSGKKITAENVLITSGSQQAVSLLAQYSLEQKLRIICEVPCYMGIPNAFGAIGHWVESVTRDKDGPVLERLNRFRDGHRSLFYLCPEMHNPMGTDLSAERLAGILEWSRSQDGLIVADEIFRELRFEGPARPSMLELTDIERTVVIGSLSKVFMCGLRIGWLIGSATLVRTLVGLKRAMDITCPPLMQGLAVALLNSGSFDEHLERAREHYRVRRDAMLDALKRHMPPGVTWTVPKGGFHLWVELPAGYSSITLYLLGVEKGVVIAPGPQMDIDHRFVSGFRLSYGSVEVKKISEGVELLASAVKKLLASPPDDPGLSGLGNFV
jgi:DNA-binding transcriptional MocR family regulator